MLTQLGIEGWLRPWWLVAAPLIAALASLVFARTRTAAADWPNGEEATFKALKADKSYVIKQSDGKIRALRISRGK